MKKQNMEMITFDEAYATVMRSAFITATETVSFTDSLNRVLSEEICSDMDMPPFNKSTVDGFACMKADLESDLEIIETIPAGTRPVKKITGNKCSRIMTGAAIPEGADMVFMVEDSRILPDGKVRFTGHFTRDNISVRGEDIKLGDTVLRHGKLIRPQDIAVLAAVGHTQVTVSKTPVVGVISTGSELVEPSEIPGFSQIRNSNSYQLMAQLQQTGITGKYWGIAKDDEEGTYEIVKNAISQSDLILISGGVSMGDFDFVPSVLERSGVKILFSKVNIQPGKPTTFGVHRKALVFGLPGNPVSSFIQFELLVKPLLYKMMGCNWNPRVANYPMDSAYSRRSSDRMALIPVIITGENTAAPVEYHGSAHISALSFADGIITIPVGKKSVEKGEVVSVRQV